MQSREESSKPTFQFSLRSLMLVPILVAIVFSTFRVAGPGGLLAVLVCGTLLGIVFTIASRHFLDKYSLAVFACAMIGAAVAVDIVGRDAKTMYPRAQYASISELLSNDGRFGQERLQDAAMFGTIVGGSASLAIAKFVIWLRLARRKRRDSEHADEVLEVMVIVDDEEPADSCNLQSSRDDNDGSRTESAG